MCTRFTFADCYNEAVFSRLTKLLIIFVAMLLIALYFMLDVQSQLSIGTLTDNLRSLKASLNSQPLLFTILFFLLYLFVTASSIPIATALTFVGGALLGAIVAPLVIVPAATIGCTLPYFASKFLFADYVQQRYGKALKRVNTGMKDSGWWFLLSARLNPILPFVVLNLVAGVANIPFRQYAVTTMLGIIPGVVMVTYAGSQLSASLEASTILRPGVFIALLFLAVVPLVIAYCQKKFLKRKGVIGG